MSNFNHSFQREHETKQQDVFTVKLSKDGTEREKLDAAKLVLRQPKDSTALKQLAWLGAKVLLDEKMKYLADTVFKNKQKNWRTGVDPDYAK